MSKRLVVAISAFLFVAIVGWDVYLYFDGVEGNTISQLIISGAEMTPYVPLGIGLFFGWLIGHFFG